jgi:hypothetical protein
MAISLPPPIAAYFAADRIGPDAVALCFTAQAIVKDEGRTHQGHDAIHAWKANAATQYVYTADPFAIEERADGAVVTAHVAGTFPGSPVDLRYAFVLDGDRIAGLTISL